MGRFRRVPRWYQSKTAAARSRSRLGDTSILSSWLRSSKPIRVELTSPGGPTTIEEIPARDDAPTSSILLLWRRTSSSGFPFPTAELGRYTAAASQDGLEASNRFRVTLPDHAVVDVEPPTGQPGRGSSSDSPDSNRDRTSMSISIGQTRTTSRSMCSSSTDPGPSPDGTGISPASDSSPTRWVEPAWFGNRDSDPAGGYCLLAHSTPAGQDFATLSSARVTDVTVSVDGRRASAWARRTVLGSGLLAIAAAVAACGGGSATITSVEPAASSTTLTGNDDESVLQRRDTPPEAVIAQFELSLQGENPIEDPDDRGGATIGSPGTRFVVSLAGFRPESELEIHSTGPTRAMTMSTPGPSSWATGTSPASQS